MTSYREVYEMRAGDMLEVIWDGNVWIAPSSGTQYAHRADAMRQEVMVSLRASGEVVDEVGDVDLDVHGEWRDEDEEEAGKGVIVRT